MHVELMGIRAKVPLIAAVLVSFCAHAQVQIRELSEFEMGTRLHERGNIRMAIELFKQGAEKGDPKSQFALATYYHFGEGIPQDFEKARNLLERSAAQGSVESTTFLGLIYRQAQGVPAQPQKAISLLTEAAKKCSDQAQYYLAEMLFAGEAAAPEEREGLGWLHVAADAGNPAAKDAVSKLSASLTTASKEGAVERAAQIRADLKCGK